MTRGMRSVAWLDEAGPGIDMRRSLDDGVIGRIVDRADWLAEPDRSIVLAVFSGGRSASEVARIRNEDPRRMRRRLARAVSRLLDPRAAYVALRSPEWPANRARVARAIFHHGCTLRSAAERCGVSLHTVRVHRDAVEGMYETERTLSTTQPSRGPMRKVDRSWR